MALDALLISIRPQYARRIINGTKAAELRRRRPRVEQGHAVLIYCSAPEMALVASAVIGRIEEDTPTSLWARVRGAAGVSRMEYGLYFAGARRAVAIWLVDVVPFEQPVSLARLREGWPAFRPPQSYRFVSASHRGDAVVLGPALRGERGMSSEL